MKITVNKAKIKKLATYAKSQRRSGTFWANIFIHAGRCWAMNGMTLLSCPFEGESKSISINERAFSELIEKAGGGKDIEIELDNAADYTEPLGSGIFKLFDAIMEAPPLAKISRMLWALLQPKGAGEICNLLVTSNQIKAELYEYEKYCEEWKFRGGCELNEPNQIEKPLLLTINDKKFQPITKKKSADFSLIVCENFQNRCLLAYEGEGGIDVYTYCPYFEQTGSIDESKRYHFSDEIKSAYKSAIEQMKEQSEPTTEPEPTTIEPVKTESEESKMQEKKEIETTTEQEGGAPAMESTSEPTTEQTEPESVQNTETEETENRPPIVDEPEPEPEPEKLTREQELDRIIEHYKNGYNDGGFLEDFIKNLQAEKGYLYASELFDICETVNKNAWNVTFIFKPYFYGKAEKRKIEPTEKVFVGGCFYGSSNCNRWDVERDQEIYTSIGNARAQFIISVSCENMAELQPSEIVEKWGGNVREELQGRYKLDSAADWINPDVKNSFKTINDIKGRFYRHYGDWTWNGIAIELRYYRDGKKLEKEPGGASHVADYTIERVPNNSRIIFNIFLGKKAAAVKTEIKPQEPERVEPQPEPIAESETEQNTDPAPVVETEPERDSDNINPQPEQEKIEMKSEKQTETKHETTANFPPTAVRLDPLELWGEPLDYSRVQVIKHNAQECGLALMVYNVKGEGALFAMAPSFWAIVKERSQFDETAQRFIEDNFESVICFFDKDPEATETEPTADPADLARNWMQDATEIKREPASIPVPVPVHAPVVACKLAAPVQIPEPYPQPTTEEPAEPDKAKPTGAELRYALSLLAMEFSIDDLISKFLKKTSKPVRKSVVEKLLFEIDRGSVPKPGESKREYIKTYYQTH